MKLGAYQKLKIDKIVSIGAYLIDEDKVKVLLPKKQLKRNLKVGDEVKVYVYKDSKNRLIATTNNVYLSVGEVAKLTVKDVNSVGAFLDIGIERDLLLPYSEQTKHLKKGEKVKVYMDTDKSGRLIATMYTSNKDITRQVKNSTIRTYEYEKNADNVYKIIRHKFKGHLIYNDKNATSEQILKDFELSKATFKKAIGKLLKDNKIKITSKGIYTY